MKMVLIPVERFRTLEKMVNNCSINKESHIETAISLSTKIPSPKANMTNTIPPDVELKMRRTEENEKVIYFPNSCKTTSNIVPRCISNKQKEECQGLNQTLGEEQRQDKLRYG